MSGAFLPASPGMWRIEATPLDQIIGYGSETATLGCGACEIRSRAAGECFLPDG
ncbi:hypothetical protein GCWU000341_01161 [Oribacterium sp. oral taxon 078 str. F0262]|nr:hypothetical protein GCWU000341_01161 [Oribacterium sp. oral taxon 078 str. F0262]